MVLDLEKELDLRGEKEKAVAAMKDFMDEMIVDLARCREVVREAFPDVAHQHYGTAQAAPQAVGTYIKEALKEARKKGLISSCSEDSPE